jgi:ABC-type phosphate transport system auxiliary subunit
MMDGPANVLIAFIVVGIPIIVLGFLFTRWFRLKEKKLDVDASLAVEKAAQYAASNAELEARVRILEKIVTDGGAHTAAQIEALREMPEQAHQMRQLETDRSSS